MSKESRILKYTTPEGVAYTRKTINECWLNLIADVRSVMTNELGLARVDSNGEHSCITDNIDSYAWVAKESFAISSSDYYISISYYSGNGSIVFGITSAIWEDQSSGVVTNTGIMQQKTFTVSNGVNSDGSYWYGIKITMLKNDSIGMLRMAAIDDTESDALNYMLGWMLNKAGEKRLAFWGGESVSSDFLCLYGDMQYKLMLMLSGYSVDDVDNRTIVMPVQMTNGTIIAIDESPTGVLCAPSASVSSGAYYSINGTIYHCNKGMLIRVE